MTRWLLGLLLGWPLFATAAAPASSLEFTASAWVEVDATGKAHVVEMGRISHLGDVPELTAVVDMIKARLRARIESWEFVPASKEGAPVPSRTHVTTRLEGTDDGSGGLAVTIRSATTGAELRERNIGGLAEAGMYAAEEGLVVVDVAYGEDGVVTAATVHDSKAFIKGRFTGRAGKDLRKGILAAARRWVFVPETVGGEPRPGTGRVPVQFCLSARCSATREGGTDAAGKRYVAMDPAVTLRSAVAGTAL